MAPNTHPITFKHQYKVQKTRKTNRGDVESNLSQGLRYLKVTFKYKLYSKEGPSCCQTWVQRDQSWLTGHSCVHVHRHQSVQTLHFVQIFQSDQTPHFLQTLHWVWTNWYIWSNQFRNSETPVYPETPGCKETLHCQECSDCLESPVPIAYYLFPIAHYQLPIAHWTLPIAHCHLPITKWLKNI